MKKIILFVFAIMLSTAIMAQVKKKAPSPIAAKPVLKNTDDSVSYAIGLNAAYFFKQQNVKNINAALVSKAINDVMKNGKPLINEQQMNAVLMACVNKGQAENNKLNAAKAEASKKEGAAFLAENKTKPGVIELPSGLQYMVLKEGNGPKPALTDKVKCHYHGTLINGKVFESSVERGQPVDFNVNGVIPGWTEALQLMPVGSKWRLFVPSNLAYGDNQQGPEIKPGSTLIFDVELLEIVK